MQQQTCDAASRKRKRIEFEELNFDELASFVNALESSNAPTQEHQSFIPDASEIPLFDTTVQQEEQQQVLDVEIVNIRLRMLEQAVVQNTKIIEQLLQERELMLEHVQQEKQGSWNYLLKIQSSMIFIRDKKTLKLIAVNNKGIEFVKQQSNINIVHAMSTPSKFINVIPPLLLLFKLNMLQSSMVKCASMKIFLPFIGVLMQAYLHVEDDFYWIELNEVKPAIYDDAFIIDDHASPATTFTVLPLENKQLAYELYLQQSKKRDCQMIATFLQKNNNKFTVEVEQLLNPILHAK